MRVGVVGLGYVGQPLAAAFADAGLSVIGYDIDEDRVDTLRSQQLPTVESTGGPTMEATADATSTAGRPTYTTDATRLRDCEVIITAVPTPVTADSKPDLSAVRAAGRTIGVQLAHGTIVVLESTVYPGATREEFVPAIEVASGFTLGEEFDVGYSPERINPGSDQSLKNTVKPISATTPDVQGVLADLYSTVVDDLYLAPSIEAAEAAKCLENAQRDLNIAFVNQFAMACAGIDGLDCEDVLAVADTKWNFQRYRPGLVEGHCIPVDPHFLIDRLEGAGASASLLSEARRVNESVVDYLLDATVDGFAERRDWLARTASDDNGAGASDPDRVLACGLAYKPNTDDVRSHAKRRLFEELQATGIEVVAYDPHVDAATVEATFGLESVQSIEAAEAAGVLVLTDHDAFRSLTCVDLVAKLAETPVIVDLTGRLTDPARTDVIYRGL